MKKMFFSLGLGLTLAANVFAADNTLDQLNSQVVDILAPFQNEATVARLTFGAVETNAERAVKVTVDANYRKVGSQNTLEVKLDNLSYDYGNGLAPTTIIKGSVSIDFTKLMSQDELNQMIPRASEMLDDIVKHYSEEEYGNAASVKSVVTSTTKDTEGNYTSLSALVALKIDLTKLPEGTEIQDVRLTDAVLSLSMNLKTGVMIDAFLISNPAYIGFEDGENGLKEELDKLLARDEESMDYIQSMVTQLDNVAGMIVEMNSPLKYLGLRNSLIKKP